MKTGCNNKLSNMEYRIVEGGIRRLLSLIAIVALLLGTLNVARAADETVTPKTEDLGPVVMLQSATHRLLSKIEQERQQIKSDSSRLMELANDVLLNHFDVNAMSRWVLGVHRKSLSKEQQQRFAHEFQALVIRFYVSALFDDPKLLDEIIAMGDRVITYEPITWDDKTKKVTVKSIFATPSGTTIPVNFKLYRSKKGIWLIYDVKVDGISLITNYRNSFAAEIRKDGFDTMLARLIKKNDE